MTREFPVSNRQGMGNRNGKNCGANTMENQCAKLIIKIDFIIFSDKSVASRV